MVDNQSHFRCNGTFTLHGTGTWNETEKSRLLSCRTVQTAPGPGMKPDPLSSLVLAPFPTWCSVNVPQRGVANGNGGLLMPV